MTATRAAVARHLVQVEGAAERETALAFHTTAKGDAILERIERLRRDVLTQILSDRIPDSHPELRGVIDRFVNALATAAPA